MSRYSRLTIKEREEISRMLAIGHSLRTIAKTIQRSPSTIARELYRNHASPEAYRAIRAQRRAFRWARKPRKPRKLEQSPWLRQEVLSLLARHWSPEQIARHLHKSYPDIPDMHVSHEAIYTYLYVLPRGSLKRELIRYLRKHHNVRRPRNRQLLKPKPIQDLISIEERPPDVADRTIPGHWEGDLLMGRRNASALGTLVERTTRYTILVPLKAKDAATVRQAFAEEMLRLPQELRRSLTYDQGQEMKEHRLFTQETQIKVYFAHPHCPWERGTNENTNGLLRQFFPKGTDFKKITYREIKEAQDLFNGRPRKVLDWDPPDKVFQKHLQSVALAT